MYSAKELAGILDKGVEVVLNDRKLTGRMLQYGAIIFGAQVCGGCTSDKKDLFNKLKTQGIMALETQKDCSFKLKEGVTSLPMKHGSSQYVTPLNLTDELAIQHLKQNKQRIKFYAVKPDNWEALVDGTENTVAVPKSEQKAATKPAKAKTKAAAKDTDKK